MAIEAIDYGWAPNVKEEDIDSVLPKYMMPTLRDYDKFRQWERFVEGHLRCLGWSNGTWFTVDGDSFGPLVRGLRMMDDKKTWRFLTYG